MAEHTRTDSGNPAWGGFQLAPKAKEIAVLEKAYWTARQSVLTNAALTLLHS